jgi:hypothetical protein
MIRYVEYSIEIPVQMSHRNEEKKNFFFHNRINSAQYEDYIDSFRYYSYFR